MRDRLFSWLADLVVRVDWITPLTDPWWTLHGARTGAHLLTLDAPA